MVGRTSSKGGLGKKGRIMDKRGLAKDLCKYGKN